MSESETPAAANSPVMRTLAKWFGGFHIFLYRATSGHIGRRVRGLEMLLLTTTGRKTGKQRTTPLVFGRDGEHFVLVASFGGQPQHPAWYHNLVANPRVKVQVGGEKREMVARTASPDERARLWPIIVDLYKGYAGYQKRTSREIPLVLLSNA